jgi:uncharacterized protein (TIGR00369 family)
VGSNSQDASFEEKVRESFDRQTFMTTLGAKISCPSEGQVEIRMPFSDRFLQQNGFMHAGTISSIMDSACGYAAYSVAPEGCDVLTVEFKVSLLAPAIGDEFLAIGKIKRRGRTLTICAADAFAIGKDGEKLIATMLGTIMNLCPSGKPVA